MKIKLNKISIKPPNIIPYIAGPTGINWATTNNIKEN
jgi:hypothetical protein